MLTSDEEMLLISSDEPLPQAARIGRIRRRVGDRRSRLVLGCRKYTSGSTPPTHWLRPVASAAPATPHLNTAMNRASSTMLVTPAATVTFRPSLGFSAAMKKLWNTFCSIKANVKPVTMRPYSTQSAIMASVAPRKRATGPMNAMPMPDSTTPSANVNSTIMENVGVLRIALAQNFGYQRRAAGADHEAHAAQDHDKRHHQIHRSEGRFAHEVGYEQPVHHAVDGREHHHHHGRQREAQQLAIGKVVG